jgi:hypothetical protein
VNGAVGGESVNSANVGIRVRRNALDARFPARADDPDGDLAAIRDQKSLDQVPSP